MDIIQARRRGVFFTPLDFAQKACEYLNKMLGKNWTQSKNYRLWDMAAGTGNLEVFLPKEFLKYCYLSTLEQDDVYSLKKTFPTATSFQYNYLEDDAEDATTLWAATLRANTQSAVSKLPNALKADLENPSIKWIILLNPPYATAQEAGSKGANKKGVADTAIRKRMHAERLGEVSRELYTQFLYRILRDFQHRDTVLGLFAPLKYLLSANYQKFRDHVFHATFQAGFVFSSEHFGGTSKTRHFPVSFILWNIGTRLPKDKKPNHSSILLEQTPFHLDVLDATTLHIGIKNIRPLHRNDFLSRWIARPRGTTVFPPFSSALNIASGNTDTRNRAADGFLASLMCPGNELQCQHLTAFLSGPQASAGALSVVPDNFEQAVVVFAARRIPKNTWLNHVDQLMKPKKTLTPQFVSDCAVWSLFDSKNQTAALRNVFYNDRVYQIENHFFPFPIGEISNWTIADENIADSLGNANNSFVADWLAKQTLSNEAQRLFDCARELYQHYFAHALQKTDRTCQLAYKIETYDAGWYQIQQLLRLAAVQNSIGMERLSKIKTHHNELRSKLLPLFREFGILT